ncbi:CoA-binding protein [Thermodesulfobacteriota bacterium]
MSNEHLGQIFEPRSIALAGISLSDPSHWTTGFFESLVEFDFKGPMYLVNPRGGKVGEFKVYRRFGDIPDTVDYVISTVGMQASRGLVEECAGKGVKVIHFCTAGFSETGEEDAIRLESELVAVAKEMGIRIIGPNCMGVYCPQSRLSFGSDFPKQSGPVALLSQSGGNATSIVRQAGARGIRFSKVVSYGNACDLNESDFLEYLADDPSTTVISMYTEGVRNGTRFRQALEHAARQKVVVLLKGGVSEGGARAAAGHTGAMAGSEAIWSSLCRQLGVIQVCSLAELVDVLETLLFMPLPKGRKVALFGAGGGNSVLIADEFEKMGLALPPLPEALRREIREFSPAAGNIFRNPIDYSQNFMETDKLEALVNTISRWEGVDFLVGFLDLTGFVGGPTSSEYVAGFDGMLKAGQRCTKPVAMVMELSTVPEDAQGVVALSQMAVRSKLPIYLSFGGAARAIRSVLDCRQRQRNASEVRK